ncbi:hypothetical protein BC938DRAFT_480564 [Jimgerdemannia flammicorona]|uniref:Uncharacterized protein n=1 Tax=Jimgerdemannia flammicorona TaxID=994334 RepID=A0A433QI69_9FUNG|nr:hypothetical protein BC938DRAFT_480564 [Jimgerdemannia flammicorona]
MKKHPIEEFSDSEKTTFTGNLQKIFKVFQSEVSKNEATSRNYINPFMVEAVFKLITKYPMIKLSVEYEFNGSLGFGIVDYVIFLLAFAIVVTEAKQHSFRDGAAQNLVQLHTASERLKRKRESIDMPALSAVYGLYRLESHGSFSVGKFHQRIPCKFPKYTAVPSGRMERRKWKFSR